MDLIDKYLGERMSTKDSPRGKAKEYMKQYNITKNKKWIEKTKKILNVFPKKDLDAFIKNNMNEAKNSSTQMECMECGKKFKKKLTKNTVEVKCPKCGGYDTDIA